MYLIYLLYQCGACVTKTSDTYLYFASQFFAPSRVPLGFLARIIQLSEWLQARRPGFDPLRVACSVAAPNPAGAKRPERVPFQSSV